MNLKRVSSAVIILFICLILNINIAFADKEIIKYSQEFDYPPYSFVKDGYLSGFEVDLIKAVFKGSIYEIELDYEMWSTIYDKVKKGEIDSCGLLGITDKRKNDVLFTDTVFKYNTAIYTRKNFTKVNVDNLKQFHIGVGKEHYTEDILKNKLGISNYSSFSTMDQALDALHSGDIDVLFENQDVINYYLVKKDLKSSILPQQINLFPLEAAFGINKSRADLVDFINKRLKELNKSGEFEQLYEKYFYSNSHNFREKVRNNIISISIVGIIALFALIAITRSYIKHLREKLLMEKILADAIFNNADVFIAALKENGNVVKFSGFVERITGYSMKEMEGKNIVQQCPSFFSLIGCKCDLQSLIEDDSFPKTIEAEADNSSGRCRTVFLQKNILFGDKPGKRVIVLVGIDISTQAEFEKELRESYVELESTYKQLASTQEVLEQKYIELETSQKDLQESEERYRFISEATNDTIWTWDFNKNKIFLSGRLYETLGITNDRKIYNISEWFNIVHPDDSERSKNIIRQLSEKVIDHFESEYRILPTSGGQKWILTKGRGTYDESGKLVLLAGSHTDITDKRKMQEKINRLAYFDDLTGLPNRAKLYEKLKKSIDKSNKNALKSAMLLIDVDNFKYINDSFGHSFGDRVLIEVAKLIKTYVSAKHMTARFGGDEFVVIMDAIEDERIAELMAMSILGLFDKHMSILDISLHISVSIGVAIYPDNGSSADELIRCADMALHDAKAMGKKNYRLFDNDIRNKVIRKISVEEAMRHALESNELELYLQPQIDSINNAIRGFEALLRWTNKDIGVISPVEFIPIAEETGLIVPIGLWVLKNACNTVIEINNKFSKEYIISVNISAVQLKNRKFVTQIKNIIQETRLKPALLEIEITESVFIESFDETNLILKELKKQGIKVSLDDFGTGYSSLAYLKKLPIDTLKIDKAFINDIETDSSNTILAETIVRMAHDLNLQVIAEGVETQTQLECLEKLSCDYIQGYLFSKPVPKHELIKYINSTSYKKEE